MLLFFLPTFSSSFFFVLVQLPFTSFLPVHLCLLLLFSSLFSLLHVLAHNGVSNFGWIIIAPSGPECCFKCRVNRTPSGGPRYCVQCWMSHTPSNGPPTAPYCVTFLHTECPTATCKKSNLAQLLLVLPCYVTCNFIGSLQLLDLRHSEPYVPIPRNQVARHRKAHSVRPPAQRFSSNETEIRIEALALTLWQALLWRLN
jgi:hypothetical protein